MYIVFEGLVGAGKSEQSKRLYEYYLEKYPKKEVIWTREPGGSPIAEAIRTVVQGTKFSEEMDPICEAYLYASSRAQTLRRIVKPVLDKGGIVIADRSFFTSLSYQAFGRGLGPELVTNINQTAISSVIPDAIIFMDLDIKVGLSRTFDEAGDKFESLDISFFKKAYQGYKYSRDNLKDFYKAWHDIDASGTRDEVFASILKALGE